MIVLSCHFRDLDALQLRLDRISVDQKPDVTASNSASTISPTRNVNNNNLTDTRFVCCVVFYYTVLMLSEALEPIASD